MNDMISQQRIDLDVTVSPVTDTLNRATRMDKLLTSARRTLRWLCISATMLATPLALAFTPPSFHGDVFDETNTLTAEQQTTLKTRIKEMRANDDIWAAVYVTQSLQGGSIEEAAVTTFEKWALGEKGKDNGVLVIIAPNEHKMRIEVGYGLEGTLTDVFCKQIVDQVYKPAFRDGRFAEGVMNGFALMSHAIHPDGPAPDISLQSAASEEQPIEFNGRVFLTQFGWVLLGNLCVPVLYVIGRRFAPKSKKEVSNKDKKSAPKRKTKDDGSGRVKTAFIIFVFLGVFFGLFAAVFSQAMPDDPEVPLGLFGANAIFGLICLLPLIFGTTSRSGRGSSGSGSSWSSSSSSSWGSDSDSGSSSGGGSSGGGGASGSW